MNTDRILYAVGIEGEPIHSFTLVSDYVTAERVAKDMATRSRNILVVRLVSHAIEDMVLRETVSYGLVRLITV